MRHKNRLILIFVLGLLSAIGPFSIDMYLPAFPEIASHLNSTVAHVSLSLSSFFIGISAGQFLYGPLLDRYGRKKPLYVGLFIYLIASVGCAFASSVNGLIALRLVQALGACVGMVASRAMVRDLFHVNENAKIFSLLMLVVGVSPILAPTLGGYTTAAFGWQSVFLVLAFLGVLIILAVYFFLPAGRPADRNYSLKPGLIIRSFMRVFREPQFYTYAFAGAIASSGLYAYIAGSPFVFMKLFGVSEKQYGWIFATIAMGLIGSSQLNSILLRIYRSEQIIRVALLCQAATGLLLFVGSILGWWELFSTIFLIFIFLCCQGFVFPNSSALSLAPFSASAGTASALLGGIQMSIGAFSAALVAFLSDHSAKPMTGVMAFCALTSFLILIVGTRIIRYRTTILDVEEQSAEMIISS
jgi:DHA1 family bicyclomycin/chloramphenicol resistance-like MFS transporter